MRPFIAIDLETTGLNPQRDQILQVGAVAYGGGLEPVEFSTLVKHPRYRGDAFALQMNAPLLRRLAEGEGLSLSRAMRLLQAFVYGCCVERPHPVGFNVGQFDVAFLKRAWCPTAGPFPLHHRCVELGSLVAPAFGDRCAPVGSTDASVEILGHEPTHDALEDARDARAIHEECMECLKQEE